MSSSQNEKHQFIHSRSFLISDVKDGKDAVEKELVRVYPYCKDHGAMNAVTPTGLYRCLMCGIGVQLTELD